MTRFQRAAQMWAVVALAARFRHVLTYEIVSEVTGIPVVGVGGMLGPVQAYCELRGLPPLQVLVVRRHEGIPGEGFIAAADIPRAQAEVFNHDWSAQRAPTTEELEQAFRDFYGDQPEHEGDE